jgi:acetyl-CoA C-acetyltransferase/3-oxo-5,6-didehydrosuberyl-CoA/3-oxoadipyl-CoA thiolase
MREALIVSAVRTPVGRAGGVLADVRPDDLAAIAVKAAVERSAIDPASIDDLILGCTNQAGEDNRNVARMAALLAGLPIEVAGQTVNRLCGSGLQAVASAAQAIKADEGDVFVAGGVESMTRAPYVMLKSAVPWNRDVPPWPIRRSDGGSRIPDEEGLDDLSGHDGGKGRQAVRRHAGEAGRFAAESQRRAGCAIKEGVFKTRSFRHDRSQEGDPLVVDTTSIRGPIRPSRSWRRSSRHSRPILTAASRRATRAASTTARPPSCS